jgi:glutathione S-transferase
MEQIGQRDDSSDRVDRCPQMRILSGPLSMFGAEVEIAAREKGIAFELIMAPFGCDGCLDSTARAALFSEPPTSYTPRSPA